MRALGYVRVSTDKQADHGVSLEAQEAKIRAMAMVQGSEIIELIVDGGQSAKIRPTAGETDQPEPARHEATAHAA